MKDRLTATPSDPDLQTQFALYFARSGDHESARRELKDDGDGRYDEDGIGGLDLHRNVCWRIGVAARRALSVFRESPAAARHALCADRYVAART